MLFLVISTPAPTRPSEVREQRKNFWPWVEDKIDRGVARYCFPRTGRGAVVMFDVDSHETLHRFVQTGFEKGNLSHSSGTSVGSEQTQLFSTTKWLPLWSNE